MRETETERKYTVCSQCVVADVNPHAYAICLKWQKPEPITSGRDFPRLSSEAIHDCLSAQYCESFRAGSHWVDKVVTIQVYLFI